ncbi:MAG: exo-alpha-sialidase [Phycisphaeraceae bacterium]|nr:exo-alpha-sialidase [Phycisphaeraceae bacterium]
MGLLTSFSSRFVSASLLVASMMLYGGCALAGPLKLSNPSFESPRLDGIKTTHTDIIGDWRTLEHHVYGCLLLHTNSPDGPDAPEGRQFAAIVNRGASDSQTTQMTQQVLPPGGKGVLANYAYSLTLSLRKATPDVNSNVFRVGLYANAEMTRPLAEIPGMMLQMSADTWTRNSVTFHSSEADAGKPMFIGIEASRIGGSMMSRMLVDDVRLESEPVMASADSISETDTSRQTPDFQMQPLFEEQRIPKIIVAPDGSVLAFGRSCSQLKRSEDAGLTWESVDLPDECRGNALVDENTGDVLVLLPKASSLWRSNDNGKTWRHEAITILPNEAGYGTPDKVPADPECSEAGITLRYGEHKGRLLMSVRLQPPDGSNDQEYWPYNYNAAIYSDDGKTWQVSGPVQSGTGEGTLAEFSDGSIYYNSRSHMSIDDRRQIAMSYDGGHMWVDWRVEETLREVGEPFYFKYGSHPSYGCNAGLVVLPPETTDGHDVLLYSTPDNPGGERMHMTVWASFDHGQTWPVKRMIYDGPSAYSSLAADKDGNIYLLFEHGEEKLYERLMLVRFNLAWLCDGKDWKQYISQ